MQWALFGIILTALVGSNAEAPISESYPDSLEAAQSMRIPVGAKAEQINPSAVVEKINKLKETWGQFPECPDTPPQRIQDISNYEIPGAKPFVLEEGRLIESSPTHGGEDIDWLNDFFFSDFCFFGQVTESEYHCLTSPFFGVGSFAYIEFKILKSFWGPTEGRLVVDTKVDRPGGCIKYEINFFESFDIGDKYLVLGWYGKGRQTFLGIRGIYQLSGNEFVLSLLFIHPSALAYESGSSIL